ncbi:MAG: hypothetical protein R6X02_17920 [Enhygromyxa sp.]
MSDPLTQAPTRLLDDPNLDPGLRRDLELASAHAPVAYSLDAGLARFEQTIHGATTVPPGGSVTGLRVLGWFLGAAVVIGGVGYLLSASPSEAPGHPVADGLARADAPGTAGTVRSEEEPVAVPPSSEVRERPAGELAHESVAEAGERDGAGDAGTASAQAEGGSPAPDAPAPLRPASKPTVDDAAKPSSPSTSLADEAAQINAARKALASDPARALALMRSAEQQFPEGAMIQERRGYTILALVALGRTSEAEAAADTYLERWPQGTLSRRVREALGR